MLELLNVNPSSGDPIYRQLSEQIVRLIVGGQLQQQQVLPSVRQIAEHLTVNPMTVSRAIQLLVEQGWLERRRGQPTRVAAREESETTSGAQLLVPQVEALIAQATQLGVSVEELQDVIAKVWHK
ncbi:GntR family transcriptional regulator [Shewanella colwelliana]|uniref:GntR family transcriptional regulator n=1 Tax=Shewanella colwelliana TaxID=23 RepID=A0A1E5IUV4_SHECO|nr:GntR family transcriptional regulator [Shewanella colwelliana]MDX1282847.1 GntR family transcriptional regulator [Shewanella colwelliana]OEG74342.1 GntR family transcriptional regulator [Shewanella colwelliana]GIU22639.1 GntR family transcriptional regulator [Shewanella colwelliana]GIU44779.1 GntR family transcriptional regulator [Shewanella colwelliana]